VDRRDFFRSVYGDAQGNVPLVLPNSFGKPTKEHWFNYPAQLEDMAAFAEANKTGDVWYSPVVYPTRSRSIQEGNVLSIVGADADSCDPENFRKRPTIEVETSPGRWHVYWKLDRPYPAQDVAVINRRVAQVHKHEGCDTAYVNAAKLLRVPGTSNNKHPGAIVFVANIEPATYTLEQFDQTYTEAETPDRITAEARDMPPGLADYIKENYAEILAGMPYDISLREMMTGKFHDEKRSEVLWKLIHRLIELGMSDENVAAIAWYAPSNKFNGEDPRGLPELWNTVVRARAEWEKSEEESDEYDKPIDGGTPQPGSKPEQRKISQFLTTEELEIIREKTNFIDQWIAWASSKTDSPQEYHRAAAITILSAVYSEFGHAIPRFGKLKLNIWFMVLGRSTQDRKSTSRSYMNRMLRALKTDEYSYQLGEDATPGGISLALHDRAHRASVYDRDEVEGLFKELLNQSYMAGGVETFTKLYDGWSGGRLRASGDKKEQGSVPVSFIMFMMGILTESADVLTITNYRSGFLTRFLYVIGRRPADYVEPPVTQAEEDDEEEDTVFQGFVTHLATVRSFWDMKTDRDEGKTYAMRVEDDAWARFSAFREEVNRQAAESKYSEIIATTSERMGWSVLKLACLLAMDERSLTVKMEHVLQAIAYAGEWYDNAVEVASMVSASEWQRDVDKLEAHIVSKGGSLSYSTAYRAFQEKRPFEFEEMVSALEQRGVLRREQNGKRWTLKIDYSE